MFKIAGSLDLLEHDLFQRRRRDDVPDPLVVPRDRPEQHGFAAGHRRRPDQQEELVEA